MNPLLIINQERVEHRQFMKLLKSYLALYSMTALISVIGIATLSYLTYLTHTVCQGGRGYLIVLPLLLSYILYLLFTLASVLVLNGAHDLRYVHMSFALLGIVKITALITIILNRNRNWGMCYITSDEGAIMISETALEIVVILFLYGFARVVFTKVTELQLSLGLKQVLSA